MAYLTSEEGPGAPLGNLYYSSWIAFCLYFYVAASCLEEIQAARAVIISGRRRVAQEFNFEIAEEDPSQQSQAPLQGGMGGTGELDLMMPSSAGRRAPMAFPSSETSDRQQQPRQRPQELGGDWTHIDANRRSGSVGEVRVDTD